MVMTISWPGGVIIVTTWSALCFRGVSSMDLDPAQLELDVLFGTGRMDPFMHRTRNDIEKLSARISGMLRLHPDTSHGLASLR